MPRLNRLWRFISIFGLFAALSMGWSVPTYAAPLTLNWTDNSDNEAGFKIERRLGDSGNFSEVGQTEANTSTFVDATPDNQVYCYRVKAVNLAGDSGPSNTACGPKALPPSGLTVTVTVTVTLP